MDDLRILGGRVIDPANGLAGPADIAIAGGLIRAVGRLDDEPARSVVRADGAVVTPGLVDLHTHVHAGGSFWGLEPDPIAWYTGVTTWVDAGTVGAFGLAGLLAARQRFAVRSAVLLHVSAHGLSARTGESRDLAFLDVDAAVTAICGHRDVVRGVKVRMDSTTVGENGLTPLRRALEVGEQAGVPVMVHIGRGPFGLNEVVDLLRPGDVITHCAGRGAIGVTEPGTIRDSLQAAYRRGVVFDLGHGAGGFSFPVVQSYLAQGMPPHVASTDLHVLCASGPAFDLPTVLTKLLAAGMSLEAVIAAATVTPARTLGLAAGTLTPGAAADLAIFQVTREPILVGDVHGETRIAPCQIRNIATMVGGRPLPPMYPPAPPPWVTLSEAQRAALDRRERALREMLCEPLVPPDGVQNQIPGGADGIPPTREVRVHAERAPQGIGHDTREDQQR